MFSGILIKEQIRLVLEELRTISENRRLGNLAGRVQLIQQWPGSMDKGHGCIGVAAFPNFSFSSLCSGTSECCQDPSLDEY